MGENCIRSPKGQIQQKKSGLLSKKNSKIFGPKFNRMDDWPNGGDECDDGDGVAEVARRARTVHDTNLNTFMDIWLNWNSCFLFDRLNFYTKFSQIPDIRFDCTIFLSWLYRGYAIRFKQCPKENEFIYMLRFFKGVLNGCLPFAFIKYGIYIFIW